MEGAVGTGAWRSIRIGVLATALVTAVTGAAAAQAPRIVDIVTGERRTCALDEAGGGWC